MPRNRAYVANKEVEQKEAEKKAARADRDDTSMMNLHESLIKFLLYVMQDLCLLLPVESSSSTDPSKKHNTTADECEQIISEEILDWSGNEIQKAYYDEPSLLLHNKMWDIMLRCPPHK